MAKGNNALLIFDFDNTITNGHMHAVFSGRQSRIKKSDFNSAAENAVTDYNIKDFLKNTDGIKNEEGLKSTLQSALSNGIEVNIASYTEYPMGLSKEQAGGISVFGRFPGDYDNQLQGSSAGEQQNQVGKNLHICKAIVEYKNNHNGQLPKTVMLIDDSVGNIKKINEFVESMSKRKEWLEKNGLSIEDINSIKFEGVQVPKKDKNVGYLERVQEFINTNLVQEPIYENLKKEEPIYATVNKSTISLEEEMGTIKSVLVKNGHNKVREVHNVQDLFKEEVVKAIKEQGYGVSSRERKEIIVKGSEQIDIRKVQKIIKNTSDRVIEGFKASEIAPKEDTYQNLKDIQNALKAKAEPVHKSAPPSLPQKRKSDSDMAIDSENKKQAYTKTIPLTKEFRAIELFFKDCAQKIIDAICNLFKKEVVTKIEGQGYSVSSKESESEITVKGGKPIDVQKINKYIADSLTQTTLKYKNEEPIFQTRQEALNADQPRKGINPNPVSRKPLAPPVSPKNHTAKVMQNRNNIDGNTIGRGG